MASKDSCCNMKQCREQSCNNVRDVGKTARKLFSPEVKFDVLSAKVGFKLDKSTIDLNLDQSLSNGATGWKTSLKVPAAGNTTFEVKASNNRQADLKITADNVKFDGLKLGGTGTIDLASKKNSLSYFIDKTFQRGKVSHTLSYSTNCCGSDEDACIASRLSADISGFFEYQKFALAIQTKTCGFKSIKDICYSGAGTYNHNSCVLTLSTCCLNDVVGSIHAPIQPGLLIGLQGTYNITSKKGLLEAAFKKTVCSGTKITGNVRSDMVASVAMKHRLNDKIVIFASNEFGLFGTSNARKSGLGLELSL